MGTSLLWFGWFGFNAGSALAANTHAAGAIINSNIAASCAALTWVFLDYRKTGKFSIISFCNGIVTGLVSITPACGFVPVWSAPIFGICGVLACSSYLGLKHKISVDDALDSFGIHGIGGIVGNLLVGIFASKRFYAMDGLTIQGGWLDGNFAQLGIQFAGTLCGFLWSFCITLCILYLINLVPGLRLRLSKQEEAMYVYDELSNADVTSRSGMDYSQLSEQDDLDVSITSDTYPMERVMNSSYQIREVAGIPGPPNQAVINKSAPVSRNAQPEEGSDFIDLLEEAPVIH